MTKDRKAYMLLRAPFVGRQCSLSKNTGLPNKGRFLLEKVMPIFLSCDHCGKPVKRKPSDVKSKKVFCSPQCLGQSRKTSVDVECAYCGKSFERMPSQLKEQNNFCSPLCANTFRQDRTVVTCDHCGCSFEKWTNRVNEKGNYCSKRCAGIASRNNAQVNSSGYRLIWVDNNLTLEHRYVMECHLGRPLRADEVVHHINENKLDNRIENLQVMTPNDHMSLHQKGVPKKPEHVMKVAESNRIKNLKNRHAF